MYESKEPYYGPASHCGIGSTLFGNMRHAFLKSSNRFLDEELKKFVEDINDTSQPFPISKAGNLF